MRLPVVGHRAWLSLAISCLFAASSLGAGTSAPAGTLRTDGKVYVGDNLVATTSVVFVGDRLRTEAGQATVNFSHGDLMVLRRQTEATLQGAPQSIVVGLSKGELVLASSSEKSPSVDVAGLLLTSEGKSPGLAQVALKGDGTLLVVVHRGTFRAARLRRDPVTLSSGQMLTVNPRVELDQGPVATGTGAHGKPTLGERLRTFRVDGLSHNASVALLATGLAAATAAAIIVPISIREARTSPFIP